MQRARDSAYGLTLIWSLVAVYGSQPESKAVKAASLACIVVTCLFTVMSVLRRRSPREVEQSSPEIRQPLNTGVHCNPTPLFRGWKFRHFSDQSLTVCSFFSFLFSTISSRVCILLLHSPPPPPPPSLPFLSLGLFCDCSLAPWPATTVNPVVQQSPSPPTCCKVSMMRSRRQICQTLCLAAETSSRSHSCHLNTADWFQGGRGGTSVANCRPTWPNPKCSSCRLGEWEACFTMRLCCTFKPRFASILVVLPGLIVWLGPGRDPPGSDVFMHIILIHTILASLRRRGPFENCLKVVIWLWNDNSLGR